MSIHVPAATLGEVAFIANTLQRNVSSIQPSDPVQVSQAWYRTWNSMVDALRRQAANTTDVYSQRSMLLRAVVYAATGMMPTLPNAAYEEQRLRVAEVGIGCVLALFMVSL